MTDTQPKKKPSILIILRRVYLEIVDGNHCAAKLIEYFKHWTKWKKSKHRTEWIYMPVRQIHEDLMGEHSVNVIRRAINKLLDLEILAHRHNPGNKQDKTWQYRINFDVLGFFLKENAQVSDDSPSIKSDQSSTQDPPKISNPQQQPDVAAPSQSINREIVQPYPVCSEPPVKQVKSQPTPANRLPLISDERIETVKDAGIPLNSTLRKAVMEYALTEVQSAIAYYRQVVKEKGQRDRPAGWLTNCLRGQWWKNETSSVSSTEKELFTQWRKSSPKYKWINSCSDISATGLEPGQIGVFIDDKWINWREVEALS